MKKTNIFSLSVANKNKKTDILNFCTLIDCIFELEEQLVKNNLAIIKVDYKHGMSTCYTSDVDIVYTIRKNKHNA